MKRILNSFMAAFGFVPRGTVVEHVITPASHAVKWQKADAQAWRQIAESELWGKLKVMTDDALIQALLPGGLPYRDNPALQQAYVLGRAMQMDYLAGFRGEVERLEDISQDVEISDDE